MIYHRDCPSGLEQAFQRALLATPADPFSPSDINEHLPLLRNLASKCEHVTEFGARRANGSTLALLAGQPSTFITWDINPVSIISQNIADLVPHVGRSSFQPRVGDTLKINIEPTDMLFIDTLHTYAQLKAELERHCDRSSCRVRKYLAFHDVETFGMVGEDGKSPGLVHAIMEFQRNNLPIWGLKYQHRNNNGLAVLERYDVDPTPGIWPDEGWPQFK